MAWWTSNRAVYRGELQSSALDLAGRGWPLVPGTYWQSQRWTGMTHAPQHGPIPVAADGLSEATDDPARINSWWSDRPYSVLIATGSVVDVIEVSALVGRRVCALLREADTVVPVAATPTGRWWFAVRAGEALRPELATRPDVVLYGRGGCIAAPPSQTPQGVVQWRIPPVASDRQLPEPAELQVAVLDVVGSRRTRSPGSVGTGIRS